MTVIKIDYNTWGSYGQYSKKIAILKSGKVLDPQNFAKHVKREAKVVVDGYEIKVVETSSRKNIHVELEVPAEAVLAIVKETKTSGNFYRDVETSEKYDIVEEEKIEVRENYNKRYYVKYLVTYLKIKDYKIELERKQVGIETELIGKPEIKIGVFVGYKSPWKVVADGDTYQIREQLKSLGFRWDPLMKEWYKPFSTKEEADKFAEEVREKLKEVTRGSTHERIQH
ncbi:MAG: hypothetical protein QXO22_04190 [Thermosphaera sp.]